MHIRRSNFCRTRATNTKTLLFLLLFTLSLRLQIHQIFFTSSSNAPVFGSRVSLSLLSGSHLLSFCDNNVLFPRDGQMKIHRFPTNSWRWRLWATKQRFPSDYSSSFRCRLQIVLSSNSALSDRNRGSDLPQIFLKSFSNQPGLTLT